MTKNFTFGQRGTIHCSDEHFQDAVGIELALTSRDTYDVKPWQRNRLSLQHRISSDKSNSNREIQSSIQSISVRIIFNHVDILN